MYFSGVFVKCAECTKFFTGKSITFLELWHFTRQSISRYCITVQDTWRTSQSRTRGGHHRAGHVVGITEQDTWWASQSRTRGGHHRAGHVAGITEQDTWRASQSRTRGGHHRAGHVAGITEQDTWREVQDTWRTSQCRTCGTHTHTNIRRLKYTCTRTLKHTHIV